MPRKKATPANAEKAEEKNVVIAAAKTEKNEVEATPAKTAKTTRTTKAAKETEKVAVYVQYAGKELLVDTVVEKAKAAYIAAGNKTTDIKTLDVYVKPEDGAAYFAVNGIGSDEFKVEL